jgi:glycosyltransferase involved in cell wall biosynthesis
MNKQNNLVSIIVRTIDNRLQYLERALKSIDDNTYPDKEVIVVYQGLNNEFLSFLQALKEKFPDLDIKIIQNPVSKDERAKNANLGMQNAAGRYIGFLDDDDIYYKNHISTIINKINQTEKAWGYAQTARCLKRNNELIIKDYPYLHQNFSFKKLWHHDYIPMISFIIDITKIKDKNILKFNENFTQGEDYLFLLNLSLNYEPACCTEITSAFLYKEETKTQQIQRKEDGKRLRKIKAELADNIYWFNEVIFDDYKHKNRLLRFSIKLFKKLRLVFIAEKLET